MSRSIIILNKNVLLFLVCKSRRNKMCYSILISTFCYSGCSGLQNLVLFMCKSLAIALDISHIDKLLDSVTEFVNVKV